MLEDQGIREIGLLRCYTETPNVMHCTWVAPGEGVTESWTESHGAVFLREPPGGEKQRARELTLETWSGGDQVPVPALGRLQRGIHPSGVYRHLKLLGQRHQHNQGPQAMTHPRKEDWQPDYHCHTCPLRSGRWSWASWKRR